MRNRVARAGLAMLIGVAATLAGLVTTGAPAYADHSVSTTFTATGGEQSWTVPAGVGSVHVELVGARGGDGAGGGDGGRRGQRVSAELAIPAGVTRLWVEVGQPGDGAQPGFGGGGVGGAGAPYRGGAGGGASDVRTCSLGGPCDSLGSRLLVAAGGGGGAGRCFAIGCGASGDGGDASVDAPGGGGIPFSLGGLPGSAGGQGRGGDGAFAVPGSTGGGGGGGGGGWFGGGGGSSGGAPPAPLLAGFDGGDGGAGASYAGAGSSAVVVEETDAEASVTISYQVYGTSLAFLGAGSGPIGAPATLRARLTRTGSGAPVAGAPLVFALAGVADCGAVTDGAGEASCVVTPQAPAGVRALRIAYAGDTVHEPSSYSGTFEVRRKPTALHWTGAVTGDYHDPARLAARLTLTDTGAPLPGMPVELALNGAETCTAVTGADGVAACEVVPQEQPGGYTATASYAGDAVHLPSGTGAGFTVTREQTLLSYQGDLNVADDEPARLAARLTEGSVPPVAGDGTPVAGAPVVLSLGSGATRQSCTADTGPDGVAACVIAKAAQPLDASGRLPVSAAYAGSVFYEPGQAAATVGLQFVTGRATGLSGRLKLLVGTVQVAATPDTGPVRVATPFATATPCTGSLSLVALQASALCAKVVATTAPGTATATATVDSVELGLPGLPAISLRDLRAVSASSCGGPSGSVALGRVLVGGVAVDVGTAANTTVPLPGLPGATLTVNEQVSVPGGLTVTAVHLVVPPTLGVSADLVIASASSTIGNCR
ncbi:choice-of-anchor P family protein [Catellatospora sp. KI3]|uniref:choice-of-anchor P family protein n=1 Tax=Catellatospora sp. KI3 TaxID=3041620 RepID=UPI00248288FF|nr:choice-of-anchor P family protein [Catellatospora sp. KI3]MDI1466135.1 choice-of-anchor P family protein [Catellatospora sp. KI3]